MTQQPQRIDATRAKSNTFVVLLFMHFWLSLSNLDAIQILVELLLTAFLAWELRTCRFHYTELTLIVIFLASMAVALVYTPLAVVLLNAKIFGLAILSLLVFSKIRYSYSLAILILIANVGLTLFQAVFGDPGWFVAVVNSVGGSWRDLLGSRPLGLFMSTHASATLTAVLLLLMIRVSRRPVIVAATGAALLIPSRSFYVLASYLCQLLWNAAVRLRVSKVVAATIAAAVIAGFRYSELLLEFDLTTLSPYFTSREQLSYTAILEQLVSIDAYTRAFALVPTDSKLLAADFINWAGNEVMYFTLMQQGGIVLAAVFTAMLFARIRGFRVFMAVSMLHYGLPTTPVAIFLLAQWAQRLTAIEKKRLEAGGVSTRARSARRRKVHVRRQLDAIPTSSHA